MEDGVMYLYEAAGIVVGKFCDGGGGSSSGFEFLKKA